MPHPDMPGACCDCAHFTPLRRSSVNGYCEASFRLATRPYTVNNISDRIISGMTNDRTGECDAWKAKPEAPEVRQ